MAYRFFPTVLLLTLCICFGPLQAAETKTATQTNAQHIKSGAIASPDQYGALVAEQILRRGGNAVDAAIATAFTLAVTYPEAGNIGGGGFMLVWFDGKPYFLDYRETAPAAAQRDMYLSADKQVIENLSLIGHQASGVPGTVMGLWLAHQKFGTLPWQDLVAPAIHYASSGFIVAKNQYQYRSDLSQQLEGKTNFGHYFGAMKAGENFRQPELADTLKRIAEHGPDDFYKGKTAELLVAEMQRGKGIITMADLASYRAGWRDALVTPWHDKQLVSAPPPSSGGIALAQLLGLKQRRSSDFMHVPHNSSQYVHLMAELEKRVYADRAQYLGDPAFVTVPQQQLLDSTYLDKRAKEINPLAISATENVKPGLEGYHTTHFSILDKHGNAVSNTYTLNLDFGSGVVVTGAGFLLNNEMDDFSAKPGVPNAFGVVGTTANEIAPGKRMLSSMSPSMLVQDNKVQLVIGTPGGSTIITSIFQVMSNLFDFDMPLQKAVAAPRFHHQLLPKDQITMEPYAQLSAEVQQQLTKKGYNLETQDWNLGDVQAIQVKAEKVTAAADPRSRGVAKVFEY
jgi:gamma-glutamyltranspeptidase / glutathione hydrolase